MLRSARLAKFSGAVTGAYQALGTVPAGHRWLLREMTLTMEGASGYGDFQVFVSWPGGGVPVASEQPVTGGRPYLYLGRHVVLQAGDELGFLSYGGYPGGATYLRFAAFGSDLLEQI